MLYWQWQPQSTVCWRGCRAATTLWAVSHSCCHPSLSCVFVRCIPSPRASRPGGVRRVPAVPQVALALDDVASRGQPDTPSVSDGVSIVARIRGPPRCVLPLFAFVVAAPTSPVARVCVFVVVVVVATTITSRARNVPPCWSGGARGVPAVPQVALALDDVASRGQPDTPSVSDGVSIVARIRGPPRCVLSLFALVVAAPTSPVARLSGFFAIFMSRTAHLCMVWQGGAGPLRLGHLLSVAGRSLPLCSRHLFRRHVPVASSEFFTLTGNVGAINDLAMVLCVVGVLFSNVGRPQLAHSI